MKFNIDILLATYNGAKYLREQIESILNQTHTSFNLWIRDDGSNDNTLEILHEYAKRDSRIQILNSHEKLGAAGNFSALMEISTAPYIAFADQDDVWHPEKLEKLARMAKKEDRGLPLLIHHDLEVVDEKLNPIHHSFWEYTHLNPYASDFSRLLLQNTVTGCAMMVNRPLLELALPVSKAAVMHDWWLTLTAASFGEILILNEPLIKYRQHTQNQIGAKSFNSLDYLRKGFKKFGAQSYKRFYEQAKAFQSQYEDSLGNDLRRKLEDFIALPKTSFFNSRRLIVKNGFWKQGTLRNITFLLTPFRL